MMPVVDKKKQKPRKFQYCSFHTHLHSDDFIFCKEIYIYIYIYIFPPKLCAIYLEKESETCCPTGAAFAGT